MNAYQLLVLRLILWFTLLAGSSVAWADWVGEVQTTKYLDPQTVNMISSRYQAGLGGLTAGDEISYIIQFTPTNEGGMVGGGGYVTDYIPAGTEVVNAQFVRLDGNGGFTQIQPTGPAAVLAACVPVYSDTGIFYSTDPRTAVYTTPASPTITQTNGYPDSGGNVPSTTHNYWDAQMVVKYQGGGCAFTTDSPVAGPDAYLKNDYTLSQGPWRRIAYPGSMIGTAVGVASGTGFIGGNPTSAGWSLSSSNPLPAGTNAVRFAAGKVTVGELFSVRITLRITNSYVPGAAIINNTEVFGGDASLDPGSKAGKDNQYKYHFPNVANANTTLTVIKWVSGMCVGVGCIPQPFSGGAVPSRANLKLRYRVLYLNSSGSVQTSVQLSDAVLPTGGALVAGSAVVLDGPNILPTTAIVGGFNFTPVSTLGSGAGGTVEFDVNFATAPANNLALSNTAKLTSFSLPAGVQSVATVTATTTANLNINKSTSTPSRTPGSAAQYRVSIANNGAVNATSVVVTDYLPTANSASSVAANRFAYVAGSVAASAVSASGVVSALPAPTVLSSIVSVGATGRDAAYIGREKVTFTFAAAIASLSELLMDFTAMIGSNVPQRAATYLNDVVVTYAGGFAAGAAAEATGVAPITVTVPLALSKTIECVFSAGTCVPYTNGNIPTGSKLRYRLSYSNLSAGAISGVMLTDTLPVNVDTVAASAVEVAPAMGMTPATVTGVLATGKTVTFNTVTLSANATGAVILDVQLPSSAVIASGSYITNNAKLVSASSLGGVAASLTSSVLDQANLEVTKTTSTPALTVNGRATYTINVKNTGGVAASNIKVYDWLPFYMANTNLNTRFNFFAGSTVFSLSNAGASTLTAPPIPVTVVGAGNIAPHNTNLNQQQILWTFTPAQTLVPGASFTLTFFADAGAAGGIPAGSTIYKNDAQTVYNSGTTVLYSANLQTAAVTVPTNLSIVKSIDCVFDSAGTTCLPYSGNGVVRPSAKIRYRLTYQNKATTAQTNVILSDILPAQTAAGSVSNVVFVSGTTPTGTATPLSGTYPAAAGGTLTFATIPSLAAGASGVLTFDVQTNAAANVTITNTGKIVSSQAPSGETSVVSVLALTIPVLTVSKTTTTPNLSVGNTAHYTITVTNTGSAPTTNLRIYDYLPYVGSTVDATQRFNFVTGSSGFHGFAGCTGTPGNLPVVTSSVPPTLTPYSSNLNQQQIKWDCPGFQLAVGATISLDFSATIGSAIPSGSYGNSVQADFDAGIAGSGGATLNQLALIDIAPLGVNIAGRVYSDANYNYIADVVENWAGAPNLFVKIAPYTAGTCGTTATAFQPITTPNGTYSFAAIPAGQYCLTLSTNSTLSDVAATAPAGWLRTAPATGIQVITVGNVDLSNQNFGLFNGSLISGRVFRDNGAGVLANDGAQGSGETGIAGVAMVANHASCTSVQCATTTDSNGDFMLRLPAAITGALTLTETNPTGMLSTGGSAGTAGGTYTRTTDTTAFNVVVGTTYTGLLFADVPDHQLMTDGALAAIPGAVVLYAHRFVAGTSGNVTFNVTRLPSPAVLGWSELIYQDSNCNSTLDSGEPAVAAALAVVAGQTVCLLVKEFVPVNAPINGQNALTITADVASTFSGTPVVLSYARHDTTTVGQASAAGLTLVKSVNTPTALPGVNLTYTITYSNNSSGVLSNVVINDMTPAYTLYQSANCGTLPLNFTGCSITAPGVGGTGAVVYTFAGTLAPAASGSVSFTVQVQP